MIWLTRLNRVPLVLNSDMIEHIEATPDTVITLSNGQIWRVRESADEVVDRIVAFRRRISGPDTAPHELREDSGQGEPETAVPQPS
ncbi:MAG: flagellar FlbD family protein [Bryobacteraceae bacterium]|jgi:flagellar protein FlbD